MQRRNFLVNAAILGVGSTFLHANSAKANSEDLTLVFDAEIQRNHGHNLDLTPAEIIELLRATQAGDLAELSIKGRSGHDHLLELNHQQLLDLLILGNTTQESKVGAGHIHNVNLVLNLISP